MKLLGVAFLALMSAAVGAAAALYAIRKQEELDYFDFDYDFDDDDFDDEFGDEIEDDYDDLLKEDFDRDFDKDFDNDFDKDDFKDDYLKKSDDAANKSDNDLAF